MEIYMWVIKPTLKGFWLGNSSNHLLTNVLGNFLWNTKPAFGWLGEWSIPAVC